MAMSTRGENMAEPDENMEEPPKEEWIRPIGKHSFVWDHFMENNDKTKVRCDHCHKTFKKWSNNVTINFAHHLRNNHYITQRNKLVTDSDVPVDKQQWMMN